jgi:hypothetical protein
MYIIMDVVLILIILMTMLLILYITLLLKNGMNNFLVSAGYLPCKTQYYKITHLTRYPPVSTNIDENIFSSDDDDEPVIKESEVKKHDSFVVPMKYNKTNKHSIDKNDNVNFNNVSEYVSSFINNINGL